MPLAARLRGRDQLGYTTGAALATVYAVVTTQNECHPLGDGGQCTASTPLALLCHEGALSPSCEVDGRRLLSTAATVMALSVGSALTGRLEAREGARWAIMVAVTVGMSAAPHWLFAATSSQFPLPTNTTLFSDAPPCNPWAAMDPHLALGAAQCLGGVIVARSVQRGRGTGQPQMFLAPDAAP